MTTSLSRKHEKETMATTTKAPWFARLGNMLATPLLRAGVKLSGPDNYPMYLLTVLGRICGQPRTMPIVLLEQHGKRYLAATYGNVHWVRTLRVAGVAMLTRGHYAESVTARDLPPGEADLVLPPSWSSALPSLAPWQADSMASQRVLPLSNVSVRCSPIRFFW
jgi:hypothetical protein